MEGLHHKIDVQRKVDVHRLEFDTLKRGREKAINPGIVMTRQYSGWWS